MSRVPGERTVDSCGSATRKDSGDALERAANVAREQGDRTDHSDCDHGEDDAVLRHRLPFFAPAQRACRGLREDEELQHLISPRFASLGTAARALF